MRKFIKVPEYKEVSGTLSISDVYIDISKIIAIRIDSRIAGIDDKYHFIKLTLDNGQEIGIMSNIEILLEVLQQGN